MIASYKAEFRKLAQRPAIWWLGGMTLAVVALIYGFAYLRYNAPTFKTDPGVTLATLKATLYPANFARTVVQDLPLVGGALMVVLGALVVGSEYSWGTLKTVYTQGPGRARVLLGQVMALSVITAGLTVAMYALAAVLSLVIATADNGATSWPAGMTILKAVGGTWLIVESWTLFGMAMAFLLRQSAMAIGLGVAYMMAIEGILFVALGTLNISWLTSVEKFFVGQNANAIGTSFGQAISVRGLGSTVQLVPANQAVLVVALYAVAFVVVGVVLARRRDVA
jgi:ABC-2 type transport system permease protein